eukprot:5438907-Pyramimonas_sp.AAC.1
MYLPGDVLGLGIVARVPGPTADLRRLRQVSRRHLSAPEHPAPVLPVPAERHPPVQRELHAGDAAPPPRVRVYPHGRGQMGPFLVLEHLFVLGVQDGAVDVKLVENVLLLVPPPCMRGSGGGQEGVSSEEYAANSGQDLPCPRTGGWFSSRPMLSGRGPQGTPRVQQGD